MFNDGKDEGPAGPPAPPQQRVNILVVGSQASDADEIRRDVSTATGFSCTARYCADPLEAMDFLKRRNFAPDMIFLDLSLLNTRYPREQFMTFRQNVPGVPLIVLTDHKDQDLQHFVMAQGAADRLTRQEVHNDPVRLRAIVEASQSRDIPRAWADAAVLAERRRSADLLKNAADNYAVNLQLVIDENDDLRERNRAAPAPRPGYPPLRSVAQAPEGANENKMPDRR